MLSISLSLSLSINHTIQLLQQATQWSRSLFRTTTGKPSTHDLNTMTDSNTSQPCRRRCPRRNSLFEHNPWSYCDQSPQTRQSSVSPHLRNHRAMQVGREYLPISSYTRTLILTNQKAKAEQFNCAQRAHANFLENAPQTMLTTLVAGLKYPQAAAGVATGWIVFRSLFLYGYVYSGKPQGKGRFLGGLFWVFQGALWAMTLAVARDLTNF